jgi:hypothetical protein
MLTLLQVSFAANAQKTVGHLPSENEVKIVLNFL